VSDALALGLFFLCAVLSAFFSGAETAVTSVSAPSVFRMREEKRHGAECLARLRESLDRTLSAILVGNTLVNAAAGSLAAAIVLPRLGERWGVLVSAVGTTAVLLVVGEVTPKTLAARSPERFALLAARPVELLVAALSPVVTLLSATARFLLRPFGVTRGEGAGEATEEDVRSLISLSQRQGALGAEEKEILHAVLDFGDLPVRDAMVPLARIVAIPVSALFPEVEAACRVHRFSRFPVTGDGPDDVVGILHAKDLFDVSDAEERSFQLSRWLRPAVFVPELQKAGDLFREMRRRRFHMAVVVDEHGSTSGIVTLEDLVEKILGDIADEHDEPASRPPTDGTTLLVEGTYALSELSRDLGIPLDEPGVETVAGFLLRRFGRIPRAGARTRAEGLEFTVERASPRAIERVRISRVHVPEGA